MAAEIVRSGFHALYANHDGKPVHRARVVNEVAPAARILLQIDDERSAAKVLSHTIDRLEDVGDLIRGERGRFWPAPFRLVGAATSKDYFVAGCVPARALPSSIAQNLRFRGALRLAKRPDDVDDMPLQSHADWIGIPDEPLDVWLNNVITDLAAIRQPFNQSLHEWKRYTPDRRESRQYFRWVQMVSRPRAMKHPWYLIQKPLDYQAVFALTWIDAQRVYLAEIPAATVDTRRMRYAIDHEYGYPVSATLRMGAKTFEVELRSSLPGGESRFLNALGTLIPNADDSYFPLRWKFDSTIESQVRNVLHRLMIDIRTEGH